MSILLAIAVAAGRGAAQTQVTGVTYSSLSNGTNVTNSKITSANDYYAVSTVSTATETYRFDGALASSVSFRRNTAEAAGSNSTVFYQYSSVTTGGGGSVTSTTVYAKGDSTPTLEEVMLSSDLTQGLRNPFANVSSSGTTTTLESNMERMDFYFSGGYTVQEGDALTFFDLENVGNYGDGFRIAVFTEVGTITINGTDYANAPTTYANTGLLVAADSFGTAVTTPTGTNAKYLRSTTTSGDNLDVSQTIATLDTNSSSASDLYLVGILISFADLGISSGTTILGYSLMAGDVSATTASDLVDWSNTTVYSTTTNANDYGNMDFMGFGAQITRPVPEPATYGALLLGTGLLALGFRRRQLRRRAA